MTFASRIGVTEDVSLILTSAGVSEWVLTEKERLALRSLSRCRVACMTAADADAGSLFRVIKIA